MVVPLDRLDPRGDVEEQVAHVPGGVTRRSRGRDVGSLEDDGVEAPEEAVMGVGHLGGAVDGGMGVL